MSIVENRTCGECTACCFTHAVPAVPTAIGENCTHCTIGKGCAVYTTRPEACSVYKCWWLKGLLKVEALRPDKIGFVVDDWRIPDEKLRCINFWEAKEGSTDSVVVQQFITSILRTGTAVVMCVKPIEQKIEPHFPEGFSEDDKERFLNNVLRLIKANGKL